MCLHFDEEQNMSARLFIFPLHPCDQEDHWGQLRAHSVQRKTHHSVITAGFLADESTGVTGKKKKKKDDWCASNAMKKTCQPG